MKLSEIKPLTERVDKMLEQLFYHFINKNITNPVENFSESDISILASQLAGLTYLQTNYTSLSKIEDFSRTDDDNKSLKFYRFLTDIDEANQQKLFVNRSKNADDFLVLLGESQKSQKEFYKILLAIKKGKDLNANINSVKSKLKELHEFYKKEYAALHTHFTFSSAKPETVKSLS